MLSSSPSSDSVSTTGFQVPEPPPYPNSIANFDPFSLDPDLRRYTPLPVRCCR